MAKIHRCSFITIFFLFSGCSYLFAQVNQQALPRKTRILFLLDASGSMLAKMENDLRMNVAKNILSDLTDSLKVNPDVELALRVYGHQYHRRLQNCKDSKLEVPFKPGNHSQIINSLKKIEPQGNTPIAYSLEQSAADFPDDVNARNIIIIITDGLESCGGNPCAVSSALQEKRIFLKPFVIGIGMEENFEKQFSCVGQYFDAKNSSEFRSVLNKAIKTSLNKTTVTVDLLDAQNGSTETNVNVTFINNFTGQPVYDFVHFRDKKGNPDSVTVDAVLSYDIIVNTIPPVIKKDILFEGGEHNDVKIKSPQGFLVITQKGHTEYKNGIKALIKKSGTAETINVQTIPNQEKYLTGKYDVEVLTLPRTYIYGVIINNKETTTLQLAAPGILNISSGVTGIGSMYSIDKDGTQKWVCSLSDSNKQETMAIQPGNYKIVFRAKNAFGSKFTEIKNFTINSGSTTSIKLFNR